MKPKYLSLFTWSDGHPVGGPDIDIGRTNDIGELDLSDHDATLLSLQLKVALETGYHVTLRIRKEYDS